jgi:hypothetical protein
MGIGAPAAIAMGASAAGGLMSASGELAAGQAQSNDLNYKAMVALYNKQLDDRKAQMASEAGEVGAATIGMKTRAAVGQERAQQSAGGIDSTTGSAAAVQKATQQLGMLDASTVRANAAKEAWGYQVEGANELNQAFADKAGADNARKASRLKAASSLLSSASTVGNMWSRFQNPSASYDY